MEESRRSALKKLGLTTGAVWAAPAISSLIVPSHAAATSISSSSSVVVEYLGVIEDKPRGSLIVNFGELGLEPSSVNVSIGGESITAGVPFTDQGTGETTFSLTDENTPVVLSEGATFLVILGGNDRYTGTVVLAKRQG